MNGNRAWQFAVGAAIAFVVAGTIMRFMPSRTAAAATRPVAMPQPTVSAPAVEATPLADEGYAGVLVAPAAVDLAATVEGRLAEISVKAGDQVAAGTIVASLDDRAARHALAVAKASAGSAAADAQQARVELALAKDRAQRRVGAIQIDGETVPIVSGEESAQAGMAAKAAHARAASAGGTAAEQAARVKQLDVMLQETQLRAPFDGIVAARYADPGTYVRPGTPVVRIISSAELRVRFAVPEEDAKKIRAGLPYVATLDSRNIDATVTAVSPEVEPASRMVFVDGTVQGIAMSEATALAGRVVRVRPRR